MKVSRRDFIRWSAAAGAWMYVSGMTGSTFLSRALGQPNTPLDPTTIAKYGTPVLIPPVMPKAGKANLMGGGSADYYEISMKQFSQQILPAGMPATTVWGYGAVSSPGKSGPLLHHAPSLTIEAKWNVPVRVKWINDLKDPATGDFLPHLLPVDPTLHWANPPGPIDTRPTFASTPGAYTGPVPICTHVHGAVGVADDSDGYAEAWYLPDAANLTGYTTQGTWYPFFAQKAAASYGVTWGAGFATFQYPNHNRASTIWYHDHTLGMTRTNVYAGPAGFYIVRGGPDDKVIDSRRGTPAILPGPAPKENDAFPSKKPYYEIPLAIQDRAFYESGSLFYPDSRTLFDGYAGPYIPDSPISPIWNPEFFGNTVMVNGNTWPSLTVEKRRYRFRFLNGCQSRFLILDFSQIPGVDAWMIGNEGGFLAAPVHLTATGANKQLLLGLAERADVIVDFTNVATSAAGTGYVLGNVGPDEPFRGFNPDGSLADGAGGALAPADPATTGQIMRFQVVPTKSPDKTTPPQFLTLPAITALSTPSVTRPLALMEEMYTTETPPFEGPSAAMLGIVNGDPNTAPGLYAMKMWSDPITENPAVGATEEWEFYNTTGDAHPMHVHEVVFEVINRQPIDIDMDAGTVQVTGTARPPEPSESGFKDTVIAYPGEVTRIRLKFNVPGQFVWHCHIVEHEDNEMMRPYRIGPVQTGQPGA